MFPAIHTNGHLQQSKQEHPKDQGLTPIQEIVRQETGDGRLIVRFLVSAMQGQLENSKPCHRLNAARQLLDLGFTEAQAFIENNTQHPNRRRTSPSPPPELSVRSVLRKIVREETDDGRDAVRFLVDVMQGSLEGFKPHHRLAAARELLHRGFDDTEPDDPDPGSEPERPHAGRPMSGYRPESPTNPYGPLYPHNTEDVSHDPADDDNNHGGGNSDDDPDTQAVEPTEDNPHEDDTPSQEPASPEAEEQDPEDSDSNSCDPNAGFPVPRDQYYDFADPPYYGEEPEAKPKPDPNALSKWELKAMEKGTLVWDSPGYPYIDSTTPGRP